MCLKYSLLIISLISLTFVTNSKSQAYEESNNEITVGIVIDEGNLDARLSIQKALVPSLVPENAVVKLKEIIIPTSDKNQSSDTPGLEEQRLCTRIFNEGPVPTVIIDASEARTQAGKRVKDFVRRYGIPTIALSSGMAEQERVWLELGEAEKEWLIQVNPPVDSLSSIPTDIILEYQLDNVALLYDSSFIGVKDKLHHMTRENIRYKLPALFMESKERIKQILLTVRNNNLTNIIVLAGMGTLNRMMETAAELKMTDDDVSYYFITRSRGQLKCPSCKSATVLMIQSTPSTAQEYNHTSTLEAVNAENKLDKYFYYDVTRYVVQTIYEIKSLGHWPTLTFPECPDDDETTKGMSLEQANERSEFSLGSEFATEGFYGKFGRIVMDDFRQGISYQDVAMKLTKIEYLRGKIYETKQGEWTFGQNHGTFVYGAYQTESDKKPMGEAVTKEYQKHMRVVIYLQPPFIMKRIVTNATYPNGFTEYYGYCIDLLNMIQAKMANKSQNNGQSWEWTYELYEVPDGRFGDKDLEKQTWNGIIGEITNRKADIGLGPVAVMAERETVVDFTVPYYDLVGINILMKKPAVPSHLFKFLTVLENNVWFSILAAYFVVSVIIFVYDRVSPYSYYNNKEGWADQKRRDFSLKETLWFCMTSLTPQGGGEGPQNLSGRVAALTWWTFGFVVIAAYTANLAAFLTVSRLDSTTESLEHLSHQFRIRYATQEDTEALVYFKRMSYIEHKFYQIWKNMSLNQALPPEIRAQFTVWDYPISDKYTKILAQMYQAKMPKSYDEGVRRTRASKSAQDGFAFIADAVQIKYAIMTHCDLYSIGNEFSRKPIALVVQQNTTLKDALSSAILKLLNERRLEKLKEDWWKQYSRVCEDTKKSSDGISIHNIGGVFIVIFAGVVLACITLVFEYIFLRIKKSNIQRNAVTQGNLLNPNYGMHKNMPGAIGRTY